MLNRRHLRIKVLQTLFAWFRSGNDNLKAGRKELMHSIDRVYDMYLFMLKTFEEIHRIAEHRITENKKKKLPSEEDLNPNTALIDNGIFQALTNDSALAKTYEKKHIAWTDMEDTFKKIYREINRSELFANYMNGSSLFKDDKEFVINLFKEFVVNNEMLHHFFEEKSIYWQDDLDLVCVAVIRTIKGIEEGQPISLLPLFKDEKDDKDFIQKLFDLTVLNSEENIKVIMSKTRNWEIDRIATMDMLLMQMAIAEVREFAEIPEKVTLNEYIEISKFYSTPKSNGFINGVLDKAFDELKKDGRIKKMGRGLIG